MRSGRRGQCRRSGARREMRVLFSSDIFRQSAASEKVIEHEAPAPLSVRFLLGKFSDCTAYIFTFPCIILPFIRICCVHFADFLYYRLSQIFARLFFSPSSMYFALRNCSHPLMASLIRFRRLKTFNSESNSIQNGTFSPSEYDQVPNQEEKQCNEICSSRMYHKLDANNSVRCSHCSRDPDAECKRRRSEETMSNEF